MWLPSFPDLNTISPPPTHNRTKDLIKAAIVDVKEKEPSVRDICSRFQSHMESIHEAEGAFSE